MSKYIEATSLVEDELKCSLADLLLFPRYLYIETVNQCNARCVMCGIDFNRRPKEFIPISLIEKITVEINSSPAKPRKIMLYLDGEPLVDKRIPDIIKEIRNASPKSIINISTNASLLFPAVSTALLEAELSEIYLSIDSLFKERYQKIRKGLTFQVTLDNIESFIRLRNQMNSTCQIRVQLIENELNLDEHLAFVEYWTSRLRLSDQVVIQKQHNWAGMIDQGESVTQRSPCHSLWGTAVIRTNGNMSLCCMDTNEDHTLGNIRDSSIKEIWTTAAPLLFFRNEHLLQNRSSICSKCNLWQKEKRVVHRGRQAWQTV